METTESIIETRRKHLVHETLIRSIDSLFWIGSTIGITNLFFGYGLPVPRVVGWIMGTFISYKNESLKEPLYLGLTIVFLLLLVWQAIVAVCLRMLLPIARYFGVGVAILGLFDAGCMGFHIMGHQLFWAPQSTACCVGILWLLLNKKGRYVFSFEYYNVILLTPQIKSRLSVIIWGIMIAFFGARTFLTFGDAIFWLIFRSDH